MATIKAEFYDFNGVSWDLIHFKTTMEQVEGLTSALAGKAASFHTHDDRYYTESEIQNDVIRMRNLRVNANGIPTANLGAPSVAEMALFQEQFDNKTAFYNQTNVFYETSTDGNTWVSFPVSDFNKKTLFGGDNNSSLTVPYGTTYFRIRLRAIGYVFLNALYAYTSTNGHSMKIHIFKKHDSDSGWTTVANSNNTVNTWPGHVYMPFNEIAFNSGATLGSHVHEVAIVFIPTWNAGYSSNNINLHKFQLWGGYPASKRNVYFTDENRNVLFPGELYAGNSWSQRVYHQGFKPSWADIQSKPSVIIEGDSRLTNSRPASDVYAWAKAVNPPTPAAIGAMPVSGGTFTGDVTIDTTAGGLIQNSKNLIFKYNRGSVGGGITQKSLYVDSNGSLIFGTEALSTLAELNNRIFMPDAATVKIQKDLIELKSSTDRIFLSDDGYMQIQSTNVEITSVGGVSINNQRVAVESTPNTLASSRNLALTDRDSFIRSTATSGTVTLTIPLDSTLNFPIGSEIHVMQGGVGALQISPVSGVTLYSEGNKRTINAQWQAATLKKIDTNTWVLMGALK